MNAAVTSDRLAALVRDHEDQDAFRQLVDRNRRAIHFVVREYEWARDYVAPDDLRQECLLGFWEACSHYERNWQASYTTVAQHWARNRLRSAVRDARRRQVGILSLDAESVNAEGESQTLRDTIAVNDSWQPEVMAEIRADLHTLSSELPQSLSQVEHEALGRIMLEEKVSDMGGSAGRATAGLRKKAANLLGYEWQRADRASAPERHARAVDMLNDGHPPNEVARRLSVSRRTVYRWADAHKREAAVA